MGKCEHCGAADSGPVDPVKYSLPVESVTVGMSTDDGRDVTDVTVCADGSVLVEVYTPRSDDPVQDMINRREPETRVFRVGERIGLAVFGDTRVDGSTLPDARLFDQNKVA